MNDHGNDLTQVTASAEKRAKEAEECWNVLQLLNWDVPKKSKNGESTQEWDALLLCNT